MTEDDAVLGARTTEGPPGSIRPLVAAVIRDGNRILVWDDLDPSTGEVVAVPIAGGIEFGETSAEAVQREVEEELGCRPASCRFLGVLEDVFEWSGKKRHELWFVYDIDLSDRAPYEREQIVIVEPDGDAYAARWRELTEFDGGARLVPTGLLELIR
jgi:8-oxo-dGTP pyrophosphatase MutT (NUDIX family)